MSAGVWPPQSDLAELKTPDPLLAPTAFGRPMRDAHFLFDPSYNPLNHGSYGTYPMYVRSRLHQCQALSEARPDAFFRYQYPALLDESRAAVAHYLGLPVDDIVLVPNASVATNTVLRNLHFEIGDVVLHMSTAYGSVKKTIAHLSETTPLESVNIGISYPMSDDGITNQFRAAIQAAKQAEKKVRLAIFDTISSMPGVRVPWERLTALCREEGVLSFVDGAHGIGQIKLDILGSQPDFFVSNLHKWLFVPRGCAAFYVPKRNQGLIRTTFPTSHGFVPLQTPDQPAVFNPLPASTKSSFVLLFEFVATLDVSTYLSIQAALEFRDKVCGGEERIMEHCQKAANEAGALAAKILGTEVLDNAERSLTKCAMTNVRLPLKVGKGEGEGEIPTSDVSKVMDWLAHHLIKDYDTYASIFWHAESLYVRFSGQIYLEPKDYERGAKALMELCRRVEEGEYLNEEIL
ncbi:MAG: hypothetical protein Q9163_001877 [Psora crenata]